jgi:hypothetical protein
MWAEEKAGVFSRKWSEGTTTVDCNAFAVTLDFQLKLVKQLSEEWQ